MSLKSLKEKFLSALPVIGPHADIEADLMLAGKKPLMWTFVAPDEMHFDDPRMQKQHEDRKRLDQAVKEGKLIALDITRDNAGHPDSINVFRHYAQPEEEDKLKRIVAFNEKTFNFQDYSEVNLDKDIGHYLGYRRRDILFFNNTIGSPYLPEAAKRWIVGLNESAQRAYRTRLLEECGHNSDEGTQTHWPKPESSNE